MNTAKEPNEYAIFAIKWYGVLGLVIAPSWYAQLLILSIIQYSLASKLLLVQNASKSS